MWLLQGFMFQAAAGPAAILDLCGSSACGTVDSEVVAALENAGADSVDVLYDAEDLSAYDLVIVNTPHSIWSSTLQSAIVEFGNSGRPLVLLGEQNDYFATANQRVQAVLDALSLSDRIQLVPEKSGSSGCLDETTDLNSSHPVMGGVESLAYNWHAPLSASGDGGECDGRG